MSCLCYVGIYNGVGDIICRGSDLTGLEYNATLKYALGGFLMLWLFVVPYIWYAVLLFKKQLVRTELTWKELMGGILVWVLVVSMTIFWYAQIVAGVCE